MRNRLSLFFIFIWFCLSGHGQITQLSPQGQISILTCGPGTALYSKFGHTAIRVQDPVQGIDWVYNYGTFDFNKPNFYSNFARGRMIYTLSRSDFPRYLYDYQLENRWVKEQLLNIFADEKNQLFQFLENNLKPKNRDYRYDFLYDNCSTKIPGILKHLLGDELNFKRDHLEKLYTFRELIHQNLNVNSWSSFGIDLALGSVIDKKASPEEHMFLPNYVLRQLNNSTLLNEPLVSRERTILDLQNVDTGNYFTTSPLFWFLLMLFFTAAITFIDYKNNTRSRWLDFFIFFVTGLPGFLILILWFLTEHTATANNFNILWAFPINFILAFYVVRKAPLPNWISKYLIALLGMLVLILIIWIARVQIFSILLMIILITLTIRYVYLYQLSKKSAGF